MAWLGLLLAQTKGLEWSSACHFSILGANSLHFNVIPRGGGLVIGQPCSGTQPWSLGQGPENQGIWFSFHPLQRADPMVWPSQSWNWAGGGFMI